MSTTKGVNIAGGEFGCDVQVCFTRIPYDLNTQPSATLVTDCIPFLKGRCNPDDALLPLAGYKPDSGDGQAQMKHFSSAYGMNVFRLRMMPHLPNPSPRNLLPEYRTNWM